MKRVVVLLGAGASVELGVPDTNGLTEIIAKRVTSDEWVRSQGGDVAFRNIGNTLSTYLTTPGIVNYEHIYHCAHELQHLQAPSNGAVDEYRPLLIPFVSKSSELNTLALQAVDRKILEVIFAEIMKACAEPQRPLDPFHAFLKKLAKRHVLRIYTTNHDDFPIQALDGLYTGFDVNTARFDGDGFWQQWDEPAVFHLHGSIHMGSADPRLGNELGDFIWYTDRLDAYKRTKWSYSSGRRRQDGGQTARFPLITGLDKLSVIQHRPFCYYYAGFAKDLMEADLIYVIGSGLGDLHINAWLHEARLRRPQPPLLLVDYWKDGFSSTLNEIQPKLVEMIHCLRIFRERPHGSAPSGPSGWTISDDSTAAVWDRGFQDFLAHPNELRAVLSLFRCEI
jgi:hypothetical protein